MQNGAIEIVHGWEIRPRDDGGFGVYDTHGLAAGPFGTRERAAAAALELPSLLPPKDQAKPVALRASAG